MNQDALNALLKAIADAIAPHIVENVIDRLNTSGMLTTEIDTRIQAKIDDLTGLDTEMIRNIVQGELEDSDFDDKISDWMSNNFDISDYEDNLEINDKISDYLSDRLRDHVRDEVRDLSFSVTVD